MSAETIRAAVLLIGDELLSGRTQDTNLRTIASFLAPYGVAVAEARVVSDDPADIVAAVNALRARYAYVFTTGGIGPTHDDKTADAVAAAFGVPIDVREDARAILAAHYGAHTELNEARLRMARIPDGATLIANPVSRAPGFQIGNVFVMAGVPSVMRAMLEDVGPRLEKGAVVRAVTVNAASLREGDLAAPLEALQRAEPSLSFGSYPWYKPPDGFGVQLVVRGADEAVLARGAEALVALVAKLGATPEVI